MPLTFGIEEEYLLVDQRSGALVSRAPALLEAGRHIDALSAELSRCQIEIATGVSDDLAHAEVELGRLRAAVTDAGALIATRPAALASHPFSSWEDQEMNTDKERYVHLEETYQVVAWSQAICGCHVHVGVDDPDLRVAVMDRARPWLPALLALSANSPYWQGTDTGYASYRTVVWRPWPTASMPPRLDTFAHYRAMVDELQAVEAIENPHSLYWYVRPSDEYATVEFRICDVCLRPGDAVALAGLIRALVAACQAEAVAGRPFDDPPEPVLSSAVWRAARYGMDGTLVDPQRRALAPAPDVVEQLLAFARPGLDEAGDTGRVRAGIEAILRDGNGAAVQRRAIAGGGTDAEIISRILGDPPAD